MRLRRTRTTLAVLASAALLTALPVGSATAADDPAPIVVVSSDFEDGTTQGWVSRATATVAVDESVAHGGTGSLATTGRTESWQGPALDVLDVFAKGTQYTISAWVRLTADAPPDSARLSVERRSGDAVAYDQVVGNTAVTAGGWVNLAGRYTLASDADFLQLYVETATGTGSFLLDDVVVSYLPEHPIQTDIPRVRDVVTEFDVGAAITAVETLGVHDELLSRHFTSVTPGNALKWDATEPTEGGFTFAQADPLIAYAKEGGLAIRGHTLVWHNQTPAWVFTRPGGETMTGTAQDKALLLSRLENHIREVAGRYRDDIGAWDVVNEVIDENQPDGMRRSPWYTITGLDYIRTAFRVAREVAPEAKLFVNDYNTNVPAKRDALFDLVRTLRDEGVPVDGVGHQMHIKVDWPSVAETRAMLEKFVPLGVEQQITEMDVSIYRTESESFPSPPADRLLQQAYVYRDMFALFREYAEHITSVTLWGLADDNTWLDTFPVTRKDAPLLFDTRLQAKPAYWAVVDPSRIDPTPSPSAHPVRSAQPVRSAGGRGLRGRVPGHRQLVGRFPGGRQGHQHGCRTAGGLGAVVPVPRRSADRPALERQPHPGRRHRHGDQRGMERHGCRRRLGVGGLPGIVVRRQPGAGGVHPQRIGLRRPVSLPPAARPAVLDGPAMPPTPRPGGAAWQAAYLPAGRSRPRPGPATPANSRSRPGFHLVPQHAIPLDRDIDLRAARAEGR